MPIVLIKETEDSDPICFELVNQDRLSRKTIDISFPGNRGLEFKGSSGHMQAVNVDEAGLYYVAPADGWPKTPIKVVIPSTSRSEEEAKKVGETGDVSMKIDRYVFHKVKVDQLWINRCSPFIFYNDNSGSKYCVTIISEKYAATTRHGGHEHLNLEQEIIIKHDDGRSHVVRVIVIEEYNETGRDYVVFEAVNPDKFDPFPGAVSPSLYGEYILLGYSINAGEDSFTAVGSRVAETKIDNKGRILGYPGASPGFSGGGCFNRYRQLLGICVEDKDSTKHHRGDMNVEKVIELSGHRSMCQLIPANELLAIATLAISPTQLKMEEDRLRKMIEGMDNDPNLTAEGLFRRDARADDFNRLKQIGSFLRHPSQP